MVLIAEDLREHNSKTENSGDFAIVFNSLWNIHGAAL